MSKLIIYEIENLCGVNYPTGKHIADAFGYVKHISNFMLTTLKSKIEKKNYVIDIWCRGSSGAMLAALLANQLEQSLPGSSKMIIIKHIKKDGENSHHGGSHTYQNNSYNIIIDDFICSGETINEILKYIDSQVPSSGFKIDLLATSGDARNERSLYKQEHIVAMTCENSMYAKKFTEYNRGMEPSEYPFKVKKIKAIN